MRENLTYKLFIFQCINCYFMLFYTAFLHPFGIQLFGIDMGRCEIRPPPGEPSCADEVRTLLYSILFSNIIVGQVAATAMAPRHAPTATPRHATATTSHFRKRPSFPQWRLASRADRRPSS